MVKESAGNKETWDRKSDRVIVTNRRALHEYFVLESLEVGIELTGTEIKSVRAGKVQLADAYARVERGELWLHGSHISVYTHGNYLNHDPDRPRRLLAHKDQIVAMRAAVEQKGQTLIPIKIYLKQGRAKVELGLCKGKQLHDKRNTASYREAERDLQRAIRGRE